MKTLAIILPAVIAVVFALYFILIGPAEKPEPEIVKLDEPLRVIGLAISTNNTDIYKDVGFVYSVFNNQKKEHPVPYLKEPWEAVNISKDYDPQTGTFIYIVGEVVTRADTVPEGLDYFEVPPVRYAVFRIKPRSRLAWGITMGRMKRYIYAEWLPGSGYRPSELIGDFELHDQRSLGRRPEIQLYVALGD